MFVVKDTRLGITDRELKCGLNITRMNITFFVLMFFFCECIFVWYFCFKFLLNLSVSFIFCSSLFKGLFFSHF